MKQSRIRSKVMWAAVIAQVISICQLTGLFKTIGVDAGVVGDTLAGILQLLTLFGVVNDPTNPEGL